MPLPRAVVSVWLLALIVVSCLFARPLHEALDTVEAARALGAVKGRAGTGRVLGLGLGLTQAHGVTDEATDGAVWGGLGEADHTHQADAPAHDQSGDRHGDPKTGRCAWCLMLAQAQAPGGMPPLVLVHHAEASPPPADPPRGLPMGRCALAASPRGPPLA